MRLRHADGSARFGPASRSTVEPEGDVVDLGEHGLDGLPLVEIDGLPGSTARERAAAYVDRLTPADASRFSRGAVLFAVASALDDFERTREGRPSYGAAVLAYANGSGAHPLDT